MMMYDQVRSSDVTSIMSSGEVIHLQSYGGKGSGRAVTMDAYQHQPLLESFAYPGTRIYERSCEVDGHAVIRIIHFQPPSPVGKLPLVIVPGLSSVIESFRGVLQEITRTHVVMYVETREKPTSLTMDDCPFDMSSFARDLEVSISMTGLEDDGYLLIGYSLGAAAIMESFRRLPIKPAQVILAEPVPQFRIPFWSLPLARMAPLLFPVIRPFVKWYMRNFMIDTKKDPEVMRIVERALDAADPVKLGRTIRSVYGFKAWDDLPGLDKPTLIVATSRDTLHHHEDILRMQTLLPDARLIDLEENKRTHSREMAVLLRELC